MDRRSIIFVLLSTVILFGWMAFFPPTPPEDAADDNQAVAEQEGENEGNPPSEGTESGSEATSGQSSESSEDTGTDPEAPPTFEAPHALVSLGSLAADSPYRMLVTLNSRGGTIQQIELADRLKSGQFRFKLVDDRAGYLGHLSIEPTSDAQGVTVGVVGPGTPADQAGLQAGDVITALGEQKVASPADYFGALNATSPGDELVVKVRRDDQALTLTAALLSRPMQVVQPLPREETDLSLRHPESFRLTLGTLEQGIWEEISDRLATEDWEVVPANSPNETVFHFRLDDVDLAPFGLKGPLSIYKRFTLAQREVESEAEFDLSYHLDLQIEIRNESAEPQTIAYSLDGPTGLPDEGWWYINKIHGRSTAMFYTAGSRDVIASSQSDPFTFLGGPEIVSNVKNAKESTLPLFPSEREQGYRAVNFVGVDTQYFNVSLIPKTEEGQEPFIVSNGYAKTVGDISKLEKKMRKTADISFRLTSQPIKLQPYSADQPESAYVQDFTVFAGPKFPELLKQYGLDSTVSYGWFAWFSVPLTWLLHVFYAIVGNYGLAIIMLTVLVRAAMIPISRKAALNAQMMQHLQPEMKRINEQFKNDMERRAKAQRELFSRYNYNPMGGCLLMFIQLPIFLGLYRGLNVDIALRDQAFIPGLQWCANLAGPDRLFVWEGFLPFLTSKTGFLGPYFNILPIITVILFLIQQKLFMPPAVDEQTKMTQRMMTYMMVFMGVMFFKVPSGLCIYFITSSTWGIIERKLLPKPTLDGKLAKIETDGGGDATVELGTKEKSAAKQRIEEQRARARKRKSR